MKFLDGKTIIITGASAGIGAATALALAKHHTNLILLARRMDKLRQVAFDCKAAGAREAVALRCDVANRADIDRAVQAAVERFQRLDVMIANAGYGFLAPIHEATEQQFDDIVATNVKGTWYCMQAAAAVMLKQDPLPGRGKDARGHIIAISSAAGKRGLPLYGLYSMTKAAQLSLAQAMRVELAAKNVYVSTVHPLSTTTEFFEVASAKSHTRTRGIGRMYPVSSVANKIVRLIQRPRPELWPVLGSNLLLTIAGFMPGIADSAMARASKRRFG